MAFLLSDKDRSVIVTALHGLSKTVPNLGFKLADVIWSLVADIESSRAANTEAGREAAHQKKLVPVAKTSASAALYDSDTLRRRVKASG